MSCRTCCNCGWVHFGIPRTQAIANVENFNNFYEASTLEVQQMYGCRKATLEEYLHCFRCRGPHTEFRESKDDDCRVGCTLQPIIHE